MMQLLLMLMIRLVIAKVCVWERVSQTLPSARKIWRNTVSE